MEPISPPSAADNDAGLLAELVIQNGRLKGTHRPLAPALTLIGRAAGCDVRLNVEGVGALHCALVQTAGGLVLRPLPGVEGTLVNGQPVGEVTLSDGDQLTVGPFQFEVRIRGQFAAAILAETIARHEREIETVRRSVEEEKDALRIQAAAVVAQQAALGEEEGRLLQRRAALQQQEEQLSAHLEDKHRRLRELHEKIKAEHAALRQERAAHEARIAETKQELEAFRHEITDGRRQLQADRQRLLNLRRRLKQRWHRHWAGERAVWRQREEERKKCRDELAQQEDRLKQDRLRLTEARLAFNGEVEVGRRRLQSAWEELRREQQNESTRQAQQHEEIATLRAGLEERELLLADTERALAAEQRRWQQQRAALEKEVEGLENRVRNFRRKIYDEEQEVRRLEALLQDLQTQVHDTQAGESEVPKPAAVEPLVPVLALPAEPPVCAADVPQPGLEELEKLSGEVADQRLYLIEQYERLVQAQQHWQQQHEAAAVDLEALARRMAEREHGIEMRERSLSAVEDRLRQQQREAVHLQRHLEGWQARMTARETAWQGDRDRLLAELSAREHLAEQRMQAVALVQQHWTKRRRREVEWLKSERSACEKLRREYAGLRDDWLRRSAALEKEQRDLTERALALEQLQLETLSEVADKAAAKRRVDKLRRRWEALSATAEKDLAKHRDELAKEATELKEQRKRLQKHATRLEALEEELGQRQLHFEQKDVLVEDELARLRGDLANARAQRERFEKQVGELRDEVERLARLLLDEAEPVHLPMAQAA